MSGGILILDDLNLQQSMDAIARRMDAMLTFELQLLACELASGGMDRAAIEAKLKDRRTSFEQWRAGQLDQFQAWLLRCDGRLH